MNSHIKVIKFAQKHIYEHSAGFDDLHMCVTSYVKFLF